MAFNRGKAAAFVRIMKTKLTLRLLHPALMALGLLCIFSPERSSLFAQGTAFTYQGRLNDGANPANGSYDLTFALFDSASGPNQVGGILTNAATAVSNGLFTVILDFGNQFPGTNRWLEIGVRTNGGSTLATLSPRQLLASTPYAVQAANANSANSVAAGNITGMLKLAMRRTPRRSSSRSPPMPTWATPCRLAAWGRVGGRSRPPAARFSMAIKQV